MATITDRVADRLAETDPANAADYRARAAALRTDLQTLDQEYDAGLRNCERRELVDQPHRLRLPGRTLSDSSRSASAA